jgi:dCMP deaminase
MEKNIPSGERYELCRSVHAEMNAIISASSEELKDSTLYLYGWDVEHNCEKIGPKPCTLCERMIINAEIKEVITFDPEDKKGYGKENVEREFIVIPVEYFVNNDPSYKDLDVWRNKDGMLCHVYDKSEGFDSIK